MIYLDCTIYSRWFTPTHSLKIPPRIAIPSGKAASSNGGNMPPNHTSQNRLLRLPSVLDRVAVSKTEWYRKVKDGTAPQSIKISERSVAWLESSIDAYVLSLANKGTK